ncbi:UvrD-helicase domain-containing protein [Chitinophagaceae bacterium LB-8]|uniref:DNA 3'-5' helicase II n=1 Tax=Paraflavisolibacter caeni TaxID=2982496 RepID=A0A9X2XWM7_9BACT|nr:UvrD-helicase domain-containing protein [Paraflavisolibacter caeni]MCU7550425.1 UvrD-helicase domain-containing protein [Paraflavisolibacter caeni]
MLVVTDEQIHTAENILFGKTGVFDDDRKTFIREWHTCDLQAVPGSGKTTALLAKLLILEAQLPLKEGGNVLVISHTNAAVEEIRHIIAKHCPRLFAEPHFIGTIQSFVDRFLAVPYYVHKFKKRPVRIDDEVYQEYQEHHKPSRSFQHWLNNRTDKEKILFKSRLLDQDTIGYAFTSDEFPLKNKNASSYLELLRIKKDCLENGILCFEDAYLLGFEYMQSIPSIKSIIQKRFRYVFVDEMQDMDSHQYDIIEQLFGDPTCLSQIQRIGDRNQSIFNDESKLSDPWVPRSSILQLNGSHRLHPQVAAVVQNLALHPIAVNGLRRTPQGMPIDIKPHLLVYKDSNKHLVINQYAQLIKRFNESGHIPQSDKNVYKAICWTTKKEEGRVRINDFHQSYSKEAEKPQINYPSLESYLHLCNQESFASIRKNILNSFLRVLRIAGVKHSSGQVFTKRTLLKFLQNTNPDTYKELKLKLYQWCCLILNRDHASALTQIKAFLTNFISLWPGKSLIGARPFLNAVCPLSVKPATTEAKAKSPNHCCPHGIPIEVTTVHAVKGQTHTATLYLESFYQKSIKKTGNYESERLAPQLKGIALASDAHEYIKQSMKMAYVGFSRPTHLLCFAVHESRYQSHLKELNSESWEVVYVEPVS